jgi:hypothetical protein
MRFVFGREVVDAARVAFADAPEVFPAHLAIPVKAKPEDDDTEAEPNRALAALEHAAKATANWISGAGHAVGAGVATTASAIGGAAGAVGGAAASLFKRRDAPGTTQPQIED